jgi:phage repressor protein C with HTH and peptisase S24 domain
MTGEQGGAAAEKNGRVAMIQGLDLKNGRRRKISQVNPAFNFRPDNNAIHFVGEVGVGAKHTNYQRIG